MFRSGDYIVKMVLVKEREQEGKRERDERINCVQTIGGII